MTWRIAGFEKYSKIRSELAWKTREICRENLSSVDEHVLKETNENVSGNFG